ncbi:MULTISPECIES: hypothetical protein [unclassified Bradyrhizobium]|uniref:hypothetical protein n=1 Tax=unclassified Bradyrhizobium TaxID=2631580 RepID=UPI0016059962|nr:MULTISPECIES: hypothetical protein [unclassified Bradyrhizobium]MBB4367205.1 hypothetical protein [Bradyrhizobium sp. CIR18]MBB4397621.1 hypothetical protein [Bradyrhizobium sp. ERR14]
MTVALRKQFALKPARPETSFGPFKLLHALPWLILAAAMRVIAFGGGAVALPAIIIADISVLLAFFATAQQSIEAAGGQSSLGALTLGEQFKLSFSILWRIMLVMIAAALSARLAGFEASYHLLAGLDGMAFDQFTHPGRFWSAWIATIVLLMIVRAERDDGRVALFGAIGEFARRGLWLGAAVIALGVINVALAYGQEAVRSAIWNFWQTSSASQFSKNLIYFVFIFSFAMLRLWITLTILTLGLRQSYVRAD